MFELIAHRGASKEAPENTLAAMQIALDLGVDYIEFDVQLSKDGIPVVIHDAVLGRTTPKVANKRVVDLDLETLQSYDAGSWFGAPFAGQKIPSLKEVLALNRGTTGLMIEVKKGHGDIKTLVAGIASCFNQASLSNILLGSFSIAIMDEMKKQIPNCSLIGIVEDYNKLPLMRELKLNRIALWYKLLNPALVQSLHEEGKKVWTFTVDDPRVVEFLVSIGVDGIITNNPRHFRMKN